MALGEQSPPAQEHTLPDGVLQPDTMRLGLLLGMVQFLIWGGSASTWAAYTELYIARECDARGVHPCKKDTVGYDACNDAASDTVFMFGLFSGLVSLLACPAVGVLGDTYGRKPALLFCCTGGFLYSLATVLLPASVQNTWLFALSLVTSLGGGFFAPVSVCFASLADATAGQGQRVRARLFGMVEACIWAGDLVGPTLGGIAIQRVGTQRSFVVSTAMYGANVLMVLLLYVDTLPQAKRRPFDWRKANPLGSLWLLMRYPFTALYMAVVFFSLSGTSGGTTITPLYAQGTFDFDALHIGYVQTTTFAANALGLFCVLPLCIRAGVPLRTLVIVATAWNAVTWGCWAALDSGWQLYALGAAQVLSAMYLPCVRTIVSSAFGPTLYGTSLAALSTVQQVTAMGAPAASAKLWKRMGRTAYICCGVFSAFGTLAALATPLRQSLVEPADTPTESSSQSQALLAEEEAVKESESE